MKKVWITSLMAATLLTGVIAVPASMYALPSTDSSSVSSSAKDSLSESELQDIEGISEYFNLSEQEKNDFIKAIQNKEDRGEYQTQGKLSWAVKALKAGFDKLPASVKAFIGVEGFLQILGVVDNFTGAIEDAIYAGALQVTGNETAAWWVTKALMLLL
ncbi:MULTISPECIES: hypothetical protein [unclassified Paenibacillus]|uniref:hypothetical protein n=1 Tax=unclassified Paenibacillus TaxID=185978 RepID=UPI0024BA8409|nr:MULTISPECIES: hypothetical protein [unclassified Paenibacillus]